MITEVQEVWTWLKDGEPRGFFKDERSLLVSYDMIPLRGLDVARDDLNREGKITTGTLVEDEGATLFVPFKDGIADIPSIDWGCRSNRYDRCLRSLCFYASFLTHEEKTHHNRFGISMEQNLVLREYKWREFSDDKRRRRPLTRLKPKAEAILADLGFSIRAARFVEAKPRARNRGEDGAIGQLDRQPDTAP